MDRFKFISHALFLYLASGILIYIPMGVILTYLPTGQIDQVEATDVDAPEMFSLEWLRSERELNRWSQFSEQNLRSFSKVKSLRNAFNKK